MRLTPTGQGVLVKPILPQHTPSPIVRPEAYAQERVQAVVLAVGPGRRTKRGVLVPPEVHPGEIVYIGPNPLNAQQVSKDGEKLLLIPENLLLGKITTQ